MGSTRHTSTSQTCPKRSRNSFRTSLCTTNSSTACWPRLAPTRRSFTPTSLSLRVESRTRGWRCKPKTGSAWSLSFLRTTETRMGGVCTRLPLFCFVDFPNIPMVQLRVARSSPQTARALSANAIAPPKPQQDPYRPRRIRKLRRKKQTRPGRRHRSSTDILQRRLFRTANSTKIVPTADTGKNR